MNRRIRGFFSLLLCLLFFLSVSGQTINLTGSPQYVKLGDLDISGNKITVEALVKFTGGVNIVSKHTDPSNVNYLMRIGTFEITTTSQFYLMSNPYAGSMQPNTWYHVAGTYDGSTIKYYVNGCIIVSQPATGNIVQNNLITAVGNQSSCQCEQFNGEIDELRIWNVARTPAELSANMFDLPNPTTQTGLKAYYKFDGNLTNLQGTTTYNGTWVGTPSYGTQPLPSAISPLGIQSVATTDASCYGYSDGAISVTATGSSLQYSLNGTTWQPSNAFSGLAASGYTVYVRSQEGCIQTTANTIVSEPAQVNASASNTGPYCPGETIQLNGSTTSGGMLSYAWTGPGGYTSSAQNPTDATQAGAYALTVTADGCTSPVSSTTVVIKPTPAGSASNTGPYCSGDVIQLNGSSASAGTLSYSWTGPGGYTSSAQNPADAPAAGAYNLVVTADGCAGAPVQTTVVIKPTPDAVASNGGPYCPGDAIQLNGSTTATGTNSFSWSGPGGYASSVQNPSDATQTGTYTMIVTSDGCPSLAATTLVAAQASPVAIAANTGPYCPGEAIQLNATGASPGITSYAWTGPGGYVSSAQNPSDAAAAGVYTLVVAAGGCTSAASSTTVVINPTPVATASNGGPYCDAAPIQLTGSSTIPGSTYAWTGPNGYTSSAQNPSNATEPGTYTLIVTAAGCAGTAVSTVVAQSPSPVAIASNTGPYYLGDPIQLQGSTTTPGTLIYSWTGPMGYTSGAQNPTDATLGGTYTLTLTDGNGCTGSASTVVAFSNEAYVIVPNVFSPNGDGTNDLFFVQEEGIKTMKCSIFNRWGQLIYEITDPAGTWDGKVSSAEEVSEGTYFYILTASDFGGKELSKEGTVFVTR